ncbi:MAG: hypothetical protein KY462_09075 [Actinobacteria bacterium]|nr:hypothetical protein [Actinomycetota bacterium]
MKRRLMTICAVAGALMMIGGPALAHYCAQESKPAGNGSAGWFLVSADCERFIATNITLNAQGKPVGGGFVDFYRDANSNDVRDVGELVVQDMFLNTGLPHQAWDAGGEGYGVTSEIQAIMKKCGGH